MSLKTPADIAAGLTRQWSRTERRLELFREDVGWPKVIKVGRPTPTEVSTGLRKAKDFLQQWRAVTNGIVHWVSVDYRGLAESLEVPDTLELANVNEWIAATGNRNVQQECRKLQNIMIHTDAIFHTQLIRRRHLVNSMTEEDCIKVAELSSLLSPKCAKGIPLRGISVAGIDTKFIENNQGLITDLLDIRFEGEVKKVGLEQFLGTIPSDFHWLLVVDLDGGLLPMERIRVRDTE